MHFILRRFFGSDTLPAVSGLVLVSIALVACHASPNAKGGEPPEEREEIAIPIADAGPVAEVKGLPEKGEERFPVDQMNSYFSSGKGAEGLKLYRWQEYESAAATLREALDLASEPREKTHLRILLATVLRDQGKYREAGDLFAGAVAGNALLKDFLHYEAAKAYAREGDPRSGVHASQVSSQGAWASDVAFLKAGAAKANQQETEAIGLYREYLASSESGDLADEARYWLGALLRKAGGGQEAREVWRRLAIDSPVSAWTERALQEDASLWKNLRSEEYLRRGMGYFVAMRNLKSEADLNRSLRRPGLSKEQRCQALFHRAKSVYKERKYSRSAPLFEPAIRACKAAGNTDYEVKSAYQAGLAYSRGGDHAKAATFYAYVEQVPQHRYADDARLRQAEEFTSLKQDAQVTKLLSSLPTKYPEGDMRGEALWRLARRAYQRGNYKGAVSWLQKQIEIVPVEEKWWAEGQALYWLGRSFAHLGRSEEAAAAYARCIAEYPLTYYSMQAFNRLRESWPEQYERMQREVKNNTSAWDGHLRDRPVYAKEAFATAVELARLGLSKPAKRQLSTLGFSVPKGRTAERDPERIDWLVATATLLDLAGDYEDSHWIGRWHTIEYRRHWPNEANAQRWRLAYPLAFWGLLQDFAAKYHYPKYLQMAIVREESAFDPARESYANAIGLTQMIFPTAHDHSVGSGIVVNRENLRHPVKNVTIGSHFLESLQLAFEGRVGLMVPGYNAGRARVRGWIRSRHSLDLDEFIERIKGDQARRYTKRVLGSYFSYHYLAEGTIPQVRNQVPFRLSKLPKKKK